MEYAIPPDLEAFAKVLNRDLVPVLVEKYESKDGEIAYRIASSELVVLPPEDTEQGKISEGHSDARGSLPVISANS